MINLLNFAEYTQLSEGVNDPSIFKAVFMAGGPGSGKSFVVGKTSLMSLGFKLVNSDIAYERALAKANLDPTPQNIFSPIGQQLRDKSKSLTKNMQANYLRGRLGLVVDGTGKDFDKISSQKKELESHGYDTMMIFVNADLESTLRRNAARDRSLSDDAVKKMWKEVQNNIGKFQSIFGARLIIVDNSDEAPVDKSTMRAYKFVKAWSKEAPSNRVAKQWLKSNAK